MNEIISHQNKRSDSLPNTPTTIRVQKLGRAFKKAEALITVQKEELTKYEYFEINKTSNNKRLPGKGRVFHEADCERVRDEERKKASKAVRKAAQKEYDGGSFHPEIDAANTGQFIPNPGEQHQE